MVVNIKGKIGCVLFLAAINAVNCSMDDFNIISTKTFYEKVPLHHPLVCFIDHSDDLNVDFLNLIIATLVRAHFSSGVQVDVVNSVVHSDMATNYGSDMLMVGINDRIVLLQHETY